MSAGSCCRLPRTCIARSSKTLPTRSRAAGRPPCPATSDARSPSSRTRFMLSRRKFIEAVGGIGAAAMASQASAQQPPAPPSTVTSPPRDFGPNAPPTTYFTDPDVIASDPLFNTYIQRNSAIARLWTGGLWCEGPAWSGQGRYLIWSDIPNNRQLRWLEEDNRVTVFR